MTRFLLFASLACVLSACAAWSGPDGERAETFGQGSITVSYPDGTSVNVNSRGLSDNFASGIVGSLVKAAAGVFGAAQPPVVNVNLPAFSADALGAAAAAASAAPAEGD